MKKQTLPQTARLSDLIDLGYSKCFAIQLGHAYSMDDSDFCLFETSDREEWGDTVMKADAAVMRDNDGKFVPGYVSQWLTPRYRLVCVASVDPTKAMTVSQADALLDATVGRVARGDF